MFVNKHLAKDASKL